MQRWITCPGCRSILWVGGKAQLSHAQSGGAHDTVASLSEAAELLTSNQYDRVIIDPAVLKRRSSPIAVDVERLAGELLRARVEIDTIMQVTDIAMSTLRLDDLLHQILSCVLELAKADLAVVLLKEDSSVRVRAMVGAEGPIALRYSIPIGESFAGSVAGMRKATYIRDARVDPLVTGDFVRERGVRSMLGVPIVHQDRLVGVLHIDWLEAHPLIEDEVRLLDLVADRCAVAIVNAQLYEQTLSLYHQLRQREEEIRGLAMFPAENPGPVLRIDREGRILYANISCSMPGECAPCEIGKTVAAELREIAARALDSGQAEEVDIDCDGRTFAMTFVPVIENSYINLYGRDITYRKIVEQQLIAARAQAEQRAAELHSCISSMTEGVVLYDADGNIVLRNEAEKEILGKQDSQSLREVLQRHPQFTMGGEPIPPEQSITARALRGEVIKRARCKMTAEDGREVILSVSSSPVRDSSGRIVGATTVFRDITEQAKLEQEREEAYERQHRISRILQSALVPPMTSLEVEGCKVALKYQAAMREAEVGGDFYDVFQLGHDKVVVVIGDVAGKGLSAAVHVAAAKHAIRSYAYVFPSPAKIMALANDALCRGETSVGLESSMLTAFMVIVDNRSATMTYTNAGHEPPLVRDANGDIEELEGPHGLALGVICGVEYTESARKFEAGDTVVMVTDGITEARQAGPVLFGKEGVIDYLRDCRAGVDDIPSGLLEAAQSHAAGRCKTTPRSLRCAAFLRGASPHYSCSACLPSTLCSPRPHGRGVGGEGGTPRPMGLCLITAFPPHPSPLPSGRGST